MNCANCGAAVPAHSDICTYCASVNDVDLGRLGAADANHHGESSYECPRCSGKMMRLQLKMDKVYPVERCQKCLGFFFSPKEELRDLVERAVPHVDDIDYERLTHFVQTSLPDNWPVKYIPCPVCKHLMNRRNYGRASGVVTDTCKDHGIWLDGGELGKLIRWARSGGRELGST